MNKKEEIFTVGDKTNNGTISKFEIGTYGIRVFFEEKPENYHVSLNSIVQHIKTSLFTTEDGVEIFEGDSYFYLHNKVNYGSMKEVWIIKLNKGFNLNLLNPHIKRFSTKKAAEEYVIWNKPCLSLNDVGKVYKTSSKEAINKSLRDSRCMSQGKKLYNLAMKKLNL